MSKRFARKDIMWFCAVSDADGLETLVKEIEGDAVVRKVFKYC